MVAAVAAVVGFFSVRRSGIYFAMLGHDTFNGVDLAHPESCTDCGACEKACPMDLLPRTLPGAAHRKGSGLYPDGASNFALCIRCGDCIAACEATTARNQGGGGPNCPSTLGGQAGTKVVDNVPDSQTTFAFTTSQPIGTICVKAGNGYTLFTSTNPTNACYSTSGYGTEGGTVSEIRSRASREAVAANGGTW